MSNSQKYLARYQEEHIHGMKMQGSVAEHCKASASTLSPLERGQEQSSAESLGFD